MVVEEKKHGDTRLAILLGQLVVLAILVIGLIVSARAANRDTEQAVHAVSSLYLDELAGRREQVVASNLQESIKEAQVAIDLMNDEDLSDLEHLNAYQDKVKKLYGLERFAFVDTNGSIYTTNMREADVKDYDFDYQNISEPEISILNLDSVDKKVIIAVPINRTFGNETLVVCYTEKSMKDLLKGVSMNSDGNDTTFCNIYTNTGVALSNVVLGGLAVEDNLLEAMKHAEFEEGNSYEAMLEDFEQLRSGEVSFTYNGIRETLSYVPVEGTNWLLTYLVREGVISEKIGSITSGIIKRSLVQSLLIIGVLLGLYSYIIVQNRRNAQLALEKETADAENRARHEELEHRLALQEQLLEQEQYRARQDEMITALSSDYRGVYYLELDQDEGVCYQARDDLDGFEVGEHFPYLASVTAYANQYVVESYRSEFLEFVQPDTVREGLKQNKVISYRYLVLIDGKESYEMVRFAGVRHPEDRDDGIVHKVGACFTDVDDETRSALAKNQALNDALKAAERANLAKTAFLSSMSHEIRTPMNAIIGLDSIALNDPETTPKIKSYLEKIGASAEHLLNLINDILDMSRIESGRMVLKKEEFSFPQLLEAVNTMFSGQCGDKGLDYQCHINGQVDDCYIGDGMKLRQVLINILGNAVKFTPEGGSVRLDVERAAHYDRQTTLRFTIADTGIGMSEEFLPHLFDAFSQEDSSNTSKYGSSGLGMAITKNIVEMMNGDIQVTSKKGKGTTFVVTVTLTDSLHEFVEEGDIAPSEMSVLIVDDDPVACEHAHLVLEKVGIASEIASSGTEAIDMVRLRHARREPYNLILVDWKMPKMDGVEATRRIRSIIGGESAIIILTAYRWDDILEEAVQAGVDSFVSKPLFAATVMEEFKSAMQRKRMVARDKKPKVELAGRKILLAEDMQVNAEIMVMVLSMRQMEVDLAENGRVAVEKFAEHPEGYYDAILMDVRMPEMDGLEATRAIRAMDRPDAQTIPIIALTANAFDEDVQRSLQAGLNAHLTKPIQPEVLFETLEGFIHD